MDEPLLVFIGSGVLAAGLAVPVLWARSLTARVAKVEARLKAESAPYKASKKAFGLAKEKEINLANAALIKLGRATIPQETGDL